MTLKCIYQAQISLLNCNFFIQLLIAFSLGYFINFSDLLYTEGNSWFSLASQLRTLHVLPFFQEHSLSLSYPQVSFKILPSQIGFSLLKYFQICDFSFIIMVVFFLLVLTAHYYCTYFFIPLYSVSHIPKYAL